MRNIKLLELDRYNNLSNYLEEQDGIYKDLNDPDETNFRIALSFELEEGENKQYPMEDILDKYYLYVSDVLQESEDSNVLKLEFAGELEDILKLKSISGKRVYNESFIAEDGKTYIKLIIEDYE